MTIEAVVLDYGGVIMDMRWDVMAALEHDHELPQGALVRTLYMTDLWRQIEVGIADPDGHLEDAHARLEQLAGSSLPRVHEAWRDAQNLIEENVELVRTLRPPYRTAVLSNASNTLVDRLTHEWRIADLFDVLISSGDVGIAKPDQKIYALAAERLQLDPAACVFVDDSQANVDAAREAGMHAIHYRIDQGHRLTDQLAMLGVRAERRSPSGRP